MTEEETNATVNGWNACRTEMLKAQQNEPQNIPENIPATQFKPVADLYEMQFDDGRTCAFHTDGAKAAQWLLTCEGNQVQEYVKIERYQDAVVGNSPVIPVYAEPHELKIPPAIEPDYEVIKGILPTANPDEYACCIAADMWNACRAEMLKAQPVSEPYKLPDNLDFDCEFENGDYDIDEEPWLRGRVDGFNEALQVIKRSLNTKQKPTAQESK